MRGSEECLDQEDRPMSAPIITPKNTSVNAQGTPVIEGGMGPVQRGQRQTCMQGMQMKLLLAFMHTRHSPAYSCCSPLHSSHQPPLSHFAPQARSSPPQLLPS
eukprot:3255859-Rhodomonas_salina.1